MDPSDDGLGRMRLARPVGSPRAVAGLPSGHTVHVIVVYAGTNESTIRTAGYGSLSLSDMLLSIKRTSNN